MYNPFFIIAFLTIVWVNLTDNMKIKPIAVVVIPLLIAVMGWKVGLSVSQAVAAGIFSMSILGTLFYWELRLSFVFLGAGIMLLTRSVNLESFLEFASLDVILFLIGMMILVGMLNEAGLIIWVVMRLFRVKNLTGAKFFFILMSISAVSSSLMGEVASMILMARVIMEITDFFDVDPVPLLISSVMATNIGSAGTVLGNPIGVLIAARGDLTFEDFLRQALPITIVVFGMTMALMLFWFRKYLKSLDEHLRQLSENKFFLSLITVPTNRKVRVSLIIFITAIASISLHRRFELALGLEENTLLMMLPIFYAGIVLLVRRDKMRHYVEKEVEWLSILFFLFLFAQAGVMKYSGISKFIADGLVSGDTVQPVQISALILFSGGFLSSMLDNTVVVASFVPVIQSLEGMQIPVKAFWWALLFGACFGGNITAIGSTANIIALDLLDKVKGRKITFNEWLKIGFSVGVVGMLTAFVLMLVLGFLG